VSIVCSVASKRIADTPCAPSRLSHVFTVAKPARTRRTRLRGLEGCCCSRRVPST
jgi:hypothetical protein